MKPRAHPHTHTRSRPRSFDVFFKQHVGTEDVSLGMSERTPSSAHCDAVVVRVDLPGDKIADIDLDVTEDRIVVASAAHRLATYLPFRVRHKDGNAKWDAAKCVLTVTLPLQKDELGFNVQ